MVIFVSVVFQLYYGTSFAHYRLLVQHAFQRNIFAFSKMVPTKCSEINVVSNAMVWEDCGEKWDRTIILSRHIHKYGSETIHSNGCVFLPDVCQLRSHTFNDVRSRFWTWTFFLPNCCKFAVECDWNSKIFQNVQILFFFLWKNRCFFR